MAKTKANVADSFSDLMPGTVKNDKKEADIQVTSTSYIIKNIKFKDLYYRDNIRTDVTIEKEFIEDIKTNGIIQALTVCFDQETGTYPIITGHRRYLALKELNTDANSPVPCIIRQDVTDTMKRITLQFSENKQRKNLSTEEEFNALAYLVNEARLGQREIARKLNLDPAYVNRILKIEELPEEEKNIALNMPKTIASEFAVAPEKARKDLKDKKNIRLTDVREAVAGRSGDKTLNYKNELDGFRITINIASDCDLSLDEILKNCINNKDLFKSKEKKNE